MHERKICFPTGDLQGVETLQVGRAAKVSRARDREAHKGHAFSAGLFIFLFVLFLLLACDHAREVERLTATAEESEKAGQLEVAANLYQRAAELRPQDFDPRYRAALLYLRDGHFTEAEDHLQRAIALRPDFAPAHLNLGVALLQKGEKAKGRQELLAALRLDARLTTAYYNLGVVEVADGRFAEAEALFKKVISIDPTHQPSYVRLGNLYVRQRQFAAALQILEQALTLNPQDAQVFFNLGLASTGLEKNEQAVAAFQQAIKLNPTHAKAYYNLGTVLLKLERYQEALQPLHEAIRLNPRWSDAFYNLAVAAARVGEKENAVRWVQQALQLNPALATEAQREDAFTPLPQIPLSSPGRNHDTRNLVEHSSTTRWALTGQTPPARQEKDPTTTHRHGETDETRTHRSADQPQQTPARGRLQTDGVLPRRGAHERSPHVQPSLARGCRTHAHQRHRSGRAPLPCTIVERPATPAHANGRQTVTDDDGAWPNYE